MPKNKQQEAQEKRLQKKYQAGLKRPEPMQSRAKLSLPVPSRLKRRLFCWAESRCPADGSAEHSLP